MSVTCTRLLGAEVHLLQPKYAAAAPCCSSQVSFHQGTKVVKLKMLFEMLFRLACICRCGNDCTAAGSGTRARNKNGESLGFRPPAGLEGNKTLYLWG